MSRTKILFFEHLNFCDDNVDATNVVKKNAYVNKQNARLLPQLPHKWQTMPPRNRAQHVSKCCQWTCFVVKKAERPNSVKCAVTTTRSKMNSATESIATHWHESPSLNRFVGTENEKQGRERQTKVTRSSSRDFRSIAASTLSVLLQIVAKRRGEMQRESRRGSCCVFLCLLMYI
jgi:hypothetical protein